MNPSVNTPTLHWCPTGEIACPRHAPTPGSTLYQREEWRLMSGFDAELLTAYRGTAPTCVHCANYDTGAVDPEEVCP